MSVTKPRDLAPFMQRVRRFLLGRDFKNALRFQDFVATRDPAPPNLPEGVSHKLFGNYYYTRDGRRLARPPVPLVAEVKKQAIAAGVKENTVATALSAKKTGNITPGKGYVWQEAPKQS